MADAGPSVEIADPLPDAGELPPSDPADAATGPDSSRVADGIVRADDAAGIVRLDVVSGPDPAADSLVGGASGFGEARFGRADTAPVVEMVDALNADELAPSEPADPAVGPSASGVAGGVSDEVECVAERPPEDTEPAIACPAEELEGGPSLTADHADGSVGGAFAVDEGGCGRDDAPPPGQPLDRPLDAAGAPPSEGAAVGPSPAPFGLADTIADELEGVPERPPEDTDPAIRCPGEELEGGLELTAGDADQSVGGASFVGAADCG